MSAPHYACHTGPAIMMVTAHKYDYRRRLPHYQKADRAVFVTFRKSTGEPFSPAARDLVLEHCLRGNAIKFHLHAAVVMPEHVHLLLTPLRDADSWPYEMAEILRLIKGASAHSVNRLLARHGPVWQEESFDHVLRSNESFEQKLEYIRQNPVRRGLVIKPEDYRWLWEEKLCPRGAGILAREPD